MAIKKSWADKSFSEKVITVGAILFILFLLITLKGLIFGGPDDTAQSESKQVSQQGLTEEDQIKKLATDQLQGKNDEDKDWLREARVNNLSDGGYTVFVAFNANREQTNSARRIYIEEKMSDIYIALYTSGKNIQNAGVTAYLPGVNQTGVLQDVVVYKSTLDQATAKSIDFGGDKEDLRTTILPRKWTATNVHADLE